jgi:hypothetical protein
MLAVSGQLNISKQKNKGPRVPAAVEFINIQFLNCNLWRVNDHSVSAKNRWPNQSLKLTEITVDEFVARGTTSLGTQTSTSAQ